MCSVSYTLLYFIPRNISKILVTSLIPVSASCNNSLPHSSLLSSPGPSMRCTKADLFASRVTPCLFFPFPEQIQAVVPLGPNGFFLFLHLSLYLCNPFLRYYSHFPPPLLTYFLFHKIVSSSSPPSLYYTVPFLLYILPLFYAFFPYSSPILDRLSALLDLHHISLSLILALRLCKCFCSSPCSS